MKLIVNGEPRDVAAATLADLCRVLDFDFDAVATAVNGDFVPKGKRTATALAANDAVEIVSPRQGG